MTQGPKRIWIDSDGGVDDALALMCAIRDPRLELAGVSTVFGAQYRPGAVAGE